MALRAGWHNAEHEVLPRVFALDGFAIMAGFGMATAALAWMARLLGTVSPVQVKEASGADTNKQDLSE